VPDTSLMPPILPMDDSSADEWIEQLCRAKRPQSQAHVDDDDDAETETWIRELTTSHQAIPQSAASASATSSSSSGNNLTVNLDIVATFDDDDAETWIRELTTSHRALQSAASASTTSSSSSSGNNLNVNLDIVATSNSAPVTMGRLSSANTFVHPGFAISLSSTSGHKRGKTDLVARPLTVIEARSLAAQHVDNMTLLSFGGEHVHSALLRNWIAVGAADLKTASLEGLAASLESRIRGVCIDVTPRHIFKIGLTRCPKWRWYNSEFGYSGSEFEAMEVLMVSQVKVIQFMESSLISRLQLEQGCWNIRPGGETPPPPSFACYLYFVFAPVDTVIAKRLSAVRRQQLQHDSERFPRPQLR
jgi:hypothetical protein